MSFQVFSTVRRSAAACLGGPTASWMASIKPNIRPLLRFGPRPPGFRPLSAAAISYTLREDRNSHFLPQRSFWVWRSGNWAHHAQKICYVSLFVGTFVLLAKCSGDRQHTKTCLITDLGELLCLKNITSWRAFRVVMLWYLRLVTILQTQNDQYSVQWTPVVVQFKLTLSHLRRGFAVCIVCLYKDLVQIW